MTEICNECGRKTTRLTPHYYAGGKNDTGHFCPDCISEIETFDAIELRKAEENKMSKKMSVVGCHDEKWTTDSCEKCGKGFGTDDCHHHRLGHQALPDKRDPTKRLVIM